MLIGGALALKELGMRSEELGIRNEELGIDCSGVGLINNKSQIIIPFLICLLFAMLMQIDANFVNDWWDFKKGTDREDRLGPDRACAQGWIKPKSMFVGIIVTTVLSCVVGLLLLLCHQQWELVLVGIACVIGCFIYTLKLSYIGLGDLLVLIFFGIVPVGFTYYVMTNGMWTLDVTLAGVGMGLITDCLLMVNNYRDYEQDKISGKKTLVVRFGKPFGRTAYIVLACVAVALMNVVVSRINTELYGKIGGTIVLFLACTLFINMEELEGKALNKLLGKKALMIFLYGLLFAACIIL